MDPPGGIQNMEAQAKEIPANLPEYIHSRFESLVNHADLEAIASL